MARILSLVIAGAIIIGTGVIHGNGTGRWGASAALEQGAKNLEKVPMNIGDWVGQDMETDSEEMEKAQAEGLLKRNYINKSTGQTITLLIVSGRPGTVGVHTPDICFQSAGRIMASREAERVTEVLNANTEGAISAEMMTADFYQPKNVDQFRQRVYWTWSADGKWIAPDNRRTAFFWDNNLYKIYLVRQMSPVETLNAVDRDPLLEFADVLFPALNQTFFGTNSGEEKSDEVAAAQ